MTSLLQDRLSRGVARNSLVSDFSSVSDRRNSMNGMLEAATAMIKSGATPDVITFVNATIDSILDEVFPDILHEHQVSVDAINAAHKLLTDHIAKFENSINTTQGHESTVDNDSSAHYLCRSEESFECAKTRKCHRELEYLWGVVVRHETELRKWHETIHEEWCVAPFPGEPILESDPFGWDTQMTVPLYSYPRPPPDQTLPLQGIALFRYSTTTYFTEYIKYHDIVVAAWAAYRAKQQVCEDYESVFTSKTDECDVLQTELETSACTRATHDRTSRRTFGVDWTADVTAYEQLVAETKLLVEDRIREWETLHIVTCLLGVVYDNVERSINEGVPCITEVSNATATTRDIDNCHQTNEELTLHLHIFYPPVPTPPTIPPVPEHPCTPAYVDEHYSAFSNALATAYHTKLDTLELDYEMRTEIVLVGTVWTAVESKVLAESTWRTQAYVSSTGSGWPGCSAPLVCTVCHGFDIMPLPLEPPTVAHACHLDQQSLALGEIDSDTFRCLDGTCIPAGGRCNGGFECGDKSDEDFCTTSVGEPAVLSKSEICPGTSDDFSSGSFSWKHLLQCADLELCVDASSQCNTFNNCPHGDEELSCSSVSPNIRVEATSGRVISTRQGISIGVKVFHDREYLFTDMGNFKDSLFVQTSNDDKDFEHDRVAMKLNIREPLTFFVATIEPGGLPWMWDTTHGTWVERTDLTGPQYDGDHLTPHKEWKRQDNPTGTSESYTARHVFSRTFAPGTVIMPGNGGGTGSYLLFVEKPQCNCNGEKWDCGQIHKCVELEGPKLAVVSGTVTDAVTGAKLRHVLVKTLHSEQITDANGAYTMSLPHGHVGFDIILDSFVNLNTVLDIRPDTIKPGFADFALTPIVANRYTAVLTWGAYSVDLDAHVTMHNKDSKEYASAGDNHVFWRNTQVPHDARTRAERSAFGMVPADFFVNLDRDDVTSYGPETVTWNNVDQAKVSNQAGLESPFVFVYRVWDFCSLPDGLSASGAKVRVDGFGPGDEPAIVYSKTFDFDKHGVRENEFLAESVVSPPQHLHRNKWTVFKLIVDPCPGSGTRCVPSVEVRECTDMDTCPDDFSDCMVDGSCGATGLPDNWHLSHGEEDPGRPNHGRCDAGEKETLAGH